jgi:tRNA-dihydrouridine synthase C
MQYQWITSDQPALILAPMEGVTDAPMRALLTERGGFSFCVSEFLRITQDLLPAHVFFRHVPELASGCTTPSGTPIQIQLLGGNEEAMAANAKRAYELGAKAIDINFGCPSPTVNNHDGGAALLRFPDRIQSIVAAVRKAVPQEIPVSAKLRLGWESKEDILVNAEKAYLGGASWITIHARTKVQGYAPPAYWEYIGEVKRRLPIPVVANGDIWSREDFIRCQNETGCQHFMIGRSALANPGLPHEIASLLGIWGITGMTPPGHAPFSQHPKEWEPILKRFSILARPASPHSQYIECRIKQWLRFATIKNSLPWVNEVKKSKTLDEIFSVLQHYSESEVEMRSSIDPA